MSDVKTMASDASEVITWDSPIDHPSILSIIALRSVIVLPSRAPLTKNRLQA
jgi:hypothetical protein